MSKIGKISLIRIMVIAVFLLFFLWTRLPGLSSDEINPDAVNWHYRSEQFVVGLKQGDFAKTYQHYHPGVTLMWIAGSVIELYKQTTGNVYNIYTFQVIHLLVKVSLVFVQLALSLYLIYLMSRIIGFNRAVLSTFLFSFEPFFLGNSRLFHMDVLFTLFILISLTHGYLFYLEKQSIWVVLCGLFIALSFLTRSLGVGLYIFLLLFGGIMHWLGKKEKMITARYFAILTLSFVAGTFVLFPALWDKPVEVLSDIFLEGERVGIRKGHEQLFFGHSTINPGYLFYPVVLFLKTTPVLVSGLLLYFFFAVRRIKFRNMWQTGRVSYLLYLSLFYTGYFLVMSFPAKKIDRYMLVLFPYLAIVATYGWFIFLEVTQKRKKLWLTMFILAIGIFTLLPLFKLFPYYFTYTNPVFGTPQKANNVVGQKPFGIGIYEVKDYLQNNFGSRVEVGFIDTKPIKSIYPNSLVSDIRINGTNDYEVLVLAVNEEFPENVIKSGTFFTKHSSLYINGLEYWRFYVKK